MNSSEAVKEKPIYFENYNLEDIVTPVKFGRLIELLKQTNYHPSEIKYLQEGFTQGFDIGYEGPKIRQSESMNIPLKIGSKTELWNKLMREVELKRVAGPFTKIPFQNYIQSPIGLVPKAGNSGKTRLIFHLSYDFKRKQAMGSLNAFTPKSKCSVKYNDLDYAIKGYLKLKAATGVSNQNKQLEEVGIEVGPIFGGKTNVQSAFHLVPLRKGCWQWLIMMAQDPETGEWKYFIDKCLPFGASISCALFQRFSNALKHLIQAKSGAIPESITNYLNDFLFLALTLLGCNLIINQFLDLCQELGVPIAIEKTEWASEYVVFLGILLDGHKLVLCLPLEKREKVIKMLQIMISKKKATVKQLQELCGYLNFICKAVYMGRPVIRRMYAKYTSSIKVPYLSNQGKYAADCNHFILKLFHHIRLDAEFKADCNIWLKFLTNPDLNELVNRPMSDWESPELNRMISASFLMQVLQRSLDMIVFLTLIGSKVFGRRVSLPKTNPVLNTLSCSHCVLGFSPGKTS